jgi:hypothetical protein
MLICSISYFSHLTIASVLRSGTNVMPVRKLRSEERPDIWAASVLRADSQVTGSELLDSGWLITRR